MNPHSPDTLLETKRFQPARILLIEDDRVVSDGLADVLRPKGYNVRQCFDGKDGLMAALNQTFDLVLLDKLLPVMDGLEVLKRLRRHRNTPVMMLTACGAEQDRIDGFSDGADDYLPKPFNMTELLLRIEALLRRSMGLLQPKASADSALAEAGLTLDNRSQQLSCNGQDIELTPLEFDLLQMLSTNRTEVLSKPYLYQAVLNKPFSRYDRSLDMHISNLRAKLATVLPDKQLIKTVRGKGYSFQ